MNVDNNEYPVADPSKKTTNKNFSKSFLVLNLEETILSIPYLFALLSKVWKLLLMGILILICPRKHGLDLLLLIALAFWTSTRIAALFVLIKILKNFELLIEILRVWGGKLCQYFLLEWVYSYTKIDNIRIKIIWGIIDIYSTNITRYQ